MVSGDFIRVCLRGNAHFLLNLLCKNCGVLRWPVSFLNQHGPAKTQHKPQIVATEALLHVHTKKKKKKKLMEINYTYVSFSPIYFLIEGLLLYRTLSFSVKHQHNPVYFKMVFFQRKT